MNDKTAAKLKEKKTNVWLYHGEMISSQPKHLALYFHFVFFPKSAT